MEIRRLLLSTQESARFDKLLFLDWERGKIRTDQVITEMETWLKSLGYIRGNNVPD